MPDRFLVIGSNSFSGATCVACLLKDGAEVVGMSRSPEPSDVFLPYKWGPHDRFRFHQLDINADLDRIMQVVDEFRPAYVINFAAQSMVAQSWEHPEHWFMTNTISMVGLHDRLRKCAFLEKYVQVSTPEVYGSTSGVIREDAPLNPSTPYAVSKAACDMSLLTFVKAYEFPAVFTRAANVCGPGQQLYRIIPRAVLSILAREKLKLQGGGTSVRSFIHMRDVSAGTIAAARRGPPGAIYHLSTDRRVSIRELVELICAAMKVRFEDHVEVVGARLGQDSAYLLDSTRAGEELGWKPAISLEDTVRETIDWMKANWDEIRSQPRDYMHKR
ncbi:MAG: GDP-mannose 4,6-dehydratase [Planctomycetota bacterium]